MLTPLRAYLMGVLTVAALIGLGYMLYAATRAAESGTETGALVSGDSITIATDIPGEWVPYMNDEYHFSLLHPPDWSVIQTEIAGAPILAIESPDGHSVSILPRGEYDRGSGPADLVQKELIDGRITTAYYYDVFKGCSQLKIVYPPAWAGYGGRVELKHAPDNTRGESELVEDEHTLERQRHCEELSRILLSLDITDEGGTSY